jgi:WD40 repeat protein
MLATGSVDKTIKIWDTKEHKLLDTFSGHRDIVTVQLKDFLLTFLNTFNKLKLLIFF